MDSDDRIDELFRRADPARTPAGLPLTAAQVKLRDQITAKRQSTSRRAWWRIPAIAIPLAATIAIAAIAAGTVFSATPAVALGPRPLTVHATSQTTPETILGLTRILDAAPSTTDARGARFDQWALEISESGEPTESSAIQASVHELDWSADGSGQQRITAGTPFSADGSDATPALEPGRSPGDLILSTTFQPGGFTPSLPTLAVLDQPDADALASFGLTASSSAGDLALLLPAVLNEWRPSAAHEARLLALLGSLDGLSVDGTTVDRLSRAAYAFTATTPNVPHRAWTVLLSPETGRFLGIEEHTVGDDPTVQVPPGTITQYTAWH